MSRILQATALLLATVAAHSWVEQMQLISSNGTYTGDLGYPRGYVARTDPAFNGYSDKWQLPSPETELGRTRIDSNDYLCHPSQRATNYTMNYPKLRVSPDSYLAMRYLENGHVTQPWIPAGKPAGSGTVFVYGTYTPSETEKIVDVLQWTTDGKGGNGKGFLMTTQNFDDGRCHQPNLSPISISRQMVDPDLAPGQESWCETDLHIPATVTPGSTLTLYWIWSWQTSPETEGAPCGKDEYYTTCADVDITGSSMNVKALLVAPAVHTLVQQDPRVQAVDDYKSRTAFMTTPNLITTEACSVTTITSSVWPASLTQHTSLPAGFLATYKQHMAQKIDTSIPTTPALTTSTLLSPSTAALPSTPQGLQALAAAAGSSQSVTSLALQNTFESTLLTTSTSKPFSLTSTLTSTSTTTATTTIPAGSALLIPSSVNSPADAVANPDGMIGQAANEGMIGQRRRRARGVSFIG